MIKGFVLLFRGKSVVLIEEDTLEYMKVISEGLLQT